MKTTTIFAWILVASNIDAIFSQVTCPDPGNVLNAYRVNINSPSGQSPVYLPGHTVLYGCKSGYVLEGNTYISCLPSGSWSSKNPVCYSTATTTTEASQDQSLCRDPGYIKNGDRMSTHPITSRQHQRGFRLGTQMTYYCVEGYQLRGTDSIYCTSGGKWTAKRPSCESTPKSG
ncbi:P-selectin-like [Uloborus diversus]|uniref:P-selectin-like n=1 Tax=Uloborus diversus TaxID=327109 RepID=UPI00240A0E34|nr:P-selectin-like [Uloborus diversus]